MFSKENNLLLILYGSQTGNAQDLAERIWRRAKHFRLNVELCSFDKLDLSKLLDENAILVGVCSTTGQGDVPDNMASFWRSMMRKQLNAGSLDTLNFTLIGLGDSSYDKYNFVAKKLHKRLLQLGAKPLLDLCLCDEQHSEGVEGQFSKWNHSFWKLLQIESDFKYDPSLSKYKVALCSRNEATFSDDKSPADELNPFYARLVNNQRVTASDHFQDVRLIELDCSTERIKYDAGDVLALRPSNTKKNVDTFLRLFSHLNLNLDQSIRIETNFENEIQLESDSSLIRSVRDLVEKYFDLNSVPRMSFFETFSQLATDELEKEKLGEFLLGENSEDLYNYCYRPRRNLLEVFHDFPHTTANINSLNVLLDLIPSLRPRYFSIASSPCVHKTTIQLLVAVVEYKTRLRETRKGTCSYWLSTLMPNSDEDIFVPVWIRRGSFKLDLDRPLICVGPGTGVAPFRSILYEKTFAFGSDNLSYLYFGCRSKTKDYYFEDEWKKIEHERPGGFVRVYAAFSRDQPEKVYVQDLMLKHSSEIFDSIYKMNAYVLIAGNSKRMPQDVRAAIEQILKENFSKELNEGDEQEAEKRATEFMKKMELLKQIQLETWS